jgi:hypothetical protein
MASRFLQGKYHPKNPHKYKGDINHITYRSSWELEMCEFLDRNQRVLQWASESIVIPYRNLIDKKIHHYYPDFYVEYISKNGEIIQEVIEIKPLAQTKPPRKNSKSKYLLFEKQTYITNVCKWKAAQAWCKEHNMQFRVITERSVFG